MCIYTEIWTNNACANCTHLIGYCDWPPILSLKKDTNKILLNLGNLPDQVPITNTNTDELEHHTSVLGGLSWNWINATLALVTLAGPPAILLAFWDSTRPCTISVSSIVPPVVWMEASHMLENKQLADLVGLPDGD